MSWLIFDCPPRNLASNLPELEFELLPVTMVNQMTRYNNMVKIRRQSSAQTMVLLATQQLKEGGRFFIKIIIISSTNVKSRYIRIQVIYTGVYIFPVWIISFWCPSVIKFKILGAVCKSIIQM